MESKKHTILNIRERKNKRVKSSFHNTALVNSSNIPEWANQQFTFESEKQLLLPEKEKTSAPVMNNDDGMLLDSFDFDSFLNTDWIEFLNSYNLQKWVNQKYPYLAQRNQLKELDLNDNEIYRYLSNHNELDLQEFTSLEKIYLAPWRASQITFKNKLEKTEVIKLINVQEWVDSQYPTPEEKVWVSELYLNEPNLAGELDLIKFTNLWRGILISPQVDETKLTFINKPTEVKIYLCQTQKALDREFPENGLCLGKYDTWRVNNQGKARKEITEIYLYNKDLEGPLMMKDFLQLVAIELSINKLTSLTLINCPSVKVIGCQRNNLTNLVVSHPEVVTNLDISSNQFSETLKINEFKNLEEFYCSYNQITNLDYSSLPVSLTKLVIRNNQLSGDLTGLNHLVNLERLDISNNPQISGSLESLTNFLELKELNIKNTNITTGLEYLPENLGIIECHANQFPELAKYEDDYLAWHQANQALIKILLASDQLTTIQTSFNHFFTKWNNYFHKHHQLTQRQQWIEYAFGLKWTGMGGGITSSVLAYKAGLPASASISFALTGTFFSGLADYTLKKLQEQEKHLERLLTNNEINIKLHQEISELETNYQALLKIFTELSTLSAQPTKSPELNQAFTNFLEAIFSLPKLEDNSGEVAITIDEIDKQEELALKEEVAKKWAKDLPTNWNKNAVDQVITNLIQECNNYRQQMYSQSKGRKSESESSEREATTSEIENSLLESPLEEGIELQELASAKGKQRAEIVYQEELQKATIEQISPKFN